MKQKNKLRDKNSDRMLPGLVDKSNKMFRGLKCQGEITKKELI